MKNELENHDNLSEAQIKYSEFLDDLISENKSMLFTNSGSEHAEILMNKIFNQTQKEINIYSRGLNPELTNSKLYRSGLNNLLNKKEVQINILLESDELKNEENSTLYHILSLKADNIKCRVLKEDAFEKLQALFKGYTHCNFCVADNNIFRYEINPERFEAIGSFNDQNISTKLNNIFEKFFIDDHSTKLN